jgi:hypothetical protein
MQREGVVFSHDAIEPTEREKGKGGGRGGREERREEREKKKPNGLHSQPEPLPDVPQRAVILKSLYLSS